VSAFGGNKNAKISDFIITQYTGKPTIDKAPPTKEKILSVFSFATR
jgi:hypothetical protein